MARCSCAHTKTRATGRSASNAQRATRASKRSRRVPGRSPDEGPDLGGGHFHLLERPRVALLGGDGVDRDGFGHAWHHLDVRLGVPTSILEARALSSYDLRRYNVIVLPPARGASEIVEAAGDLLGDWVRAGGLLIASGSSATALAGAEGDWTRVALRRDVLGELDSFARAVEREVAARSNEPDLGAVWEETRPESPEPESDERDSESAAEDAELEAWNRRFSPAGVTLAADVDVDHWITVGTRERLPVGFAGSAVLVSKPPVETPVRIAREDLRLGGLLWPEARERIRGAAYVTSESRGHGGVVLFARSPVFRGVSRGTARLLSNAVVYGPGRAANAPLKW